MIENVFDIRANDQLQGIGEQSYLFLTRLFKEKPVIRR